MPALPIVASGRSTACVAESASISARRLTSRRSVTLTRRSCRVLRHASSTHAHVCVSARHAAMRFGRHACRRGTRCSPGYCRSMRHAVDGIALHGRWHIRLPHLRLRRGSQCGLTRRSTRTSRMRGCARRSGPPVSLSSLGRTAVRRHADRARCVQRIAVVLGGRCRVTHSASCAQLSSRALPIAARRAYRLVGAARRWRFDAAIATFAHLASASGSQSTGAPRLPERSLVAMAIVVRIMVAVVLSVSARQGRVCGLTRRSTRTSRVRALRAAQRAAG